MSNMYYGWYSINDYGALLQEEKEHNAVKAMSYLRQHRFTIYAAAGIVGNMWAESQMSPGQWQNNVPYGNGYGLVQWTPYTLYSNWAGANWENNGPLEMKRLQYEKDTNIEFWHNQTIMPGWNWTNFSEITPGPNETDYDAVNLATEVFCYRYLAPGNPAGTMANRQLHARYVFDNCKGSAIPVWLLFKMSKLNRRDYK